VLPREIQGPEQARSGSGPLPDSVRDASGLLAGSHDGLEHMLPRTAAVVAAQYETAQGEPTDLLVHLIRVLQQGDAFVTERRCYEKTDAAGDTLIEGWSIDDENLLRFQGRLWVPGDNALRREIMRRNHDEPNGGHYGVRKTEQALGSKYF